MLKNVPQGKVTNQLTPGDSSHLGGIILCDALQFRINDICKFDFPGMCVDKTEKRVINGLLLDSTIVDVVAHGRERWARGGQSWRES